MRADAAVAELSITLERRGSQPAVVFDLTEPTFKSKSSDWQYTTAAQDLAETSALYLLFYPITNGQITVHTVTVAK